MKEPTWVLQDVVIVVQQALLAEHGELSGIRDEALLESALSRPKHLYADSVTILSWLLLTAMD